MRDFLNPSRSAGILLVASLFIPLLALIILISSGALAAFSATLQGSLERMAPYAATFRVTNLLYAVGWIVQLLGFILLARLLVRAGEEQLAILAFTAVLIATILGLLHATFHMTVATWAAQDTARTGSLPEVYEPLRIWISGTFRIAYLLHLLAMAGFGWVILRTNLLASWMGQVVIGWSLLWIVGYFIGAGAPGLLFLMPAVTGAALLWG